MKLSAYNGWTGEERAASLPRFREAFRTGELKRPPHCSICGFEHGSDPTGKNYTTWHCEDYTKLAEYPVCYKCHGILHSRFYRPNPWQRLIEEHGDGNQWFEMLTMDPASRDRPFRETYPDGLPAHDTNCSS